MNDYLEKEIDGIEQKFQAEACYLPGYSLIGMSSTEEGRSAFQSIERKSEHTRIDAKFLQVFDFLCDISELTASSGITFTAGEITHMNLVND